MTWLELPLVRLLVALFVGLVIGVERERRKVERGSDAFAGLRTFGLVGLLGGLFAHLGGVGLVLTGAVLVTSFSLLSHALDKRRDDDAGITTEVALVVTYALGVLAGGDPTLAAGVAVLVAWLLAMRGFLHKLVRETLTRAELSSALTFLLLALVVLPAVPDVALGPYHAIRPLSIARLVVVLTAVSSAGHVAQRMIGPRFGLLLSGFLGGFVSSSATIAAAALETRERPLHWRVAAAGALASSVATVVEYVILVGAVDLDLLRALAWPLGLGLVAALVATGTLTRRSASEPVEAPADARVLSLWMTVVMALGLALVALGVAALQSWMGPVGVVVGSSVAALVDAHATSGSVASFHEAGTVDTPTAVLAVVSALSANSLTKMAVSMPSRHRAFVLAVGAGLVSIAASAWLGVYIGSL
jgi:uncharacterized membrane protein (DUF4010 family)